MSPPPIPYRERASPASFGPITDSTWSKSARSMPRSSRSWSPTRWTRRPPRPFGHSSTGPLSALEAGARGVLRRNQATPENLFEAIRAAAGGEGALSPDLLGRLLDQVGRLQRQVLNPRGLSFAVLTDREIKVLKLLADGLDTAEVGRRLDRKSVV